MPEEKFKDQFSKYEAARILGARALQIAMNAPLLIKLKKEDLEKVKYDALKIAEIEFESGVLPISIKRPFPKRKDEKLKRIQEQTSEKKIKGIDSGEEEEIAKEGEIMKLVNPEEEMDDEERNKEDEE